MPISVSPTPEEIWAYATRELTKYSRAFAIRFYGNDTYTTFVNAYQTGTAVATFILPYVEVAKGIGGLLSAGVSKLIAIVTYKLVTYGTAKIYFSWGADSILIDDISGQTAGTSVINSKAVELTPYLKDDILYVKADLAGDGTNNSLAYLYNLILIGVIE